MNLSLLFTIVSAQRHRRQAPTPSTATTTTTRVTGTPRTISTVFLMARALLDGSGLNGFVVTDVNNYGCVGRGEFDPYSKMMGKPVDALDKVFFNWKKTH